MTSYACIKDLFLLTMFFLNTVYVVWYELYSITKIILAPKIFKLFVNVRLLTNIDIIINMSKLGLVFSNLFGPS